MFTKASRTHKLRYMSAKCRSEKTINMASISSHSDLKNRFSNFWHMHLLFFYNRIKFEKKKNRTACEKKATAVKKRYNFFMRGIIRIRRHGFVGECSDNMLSEFQPIWSRGCQLGTRNAYTTCPFFYFRETEKNYSSAASKYYEIITPRKKSQRNQLSI